MVTQVGDGRERHALRVNNSENTGPACQPLPDIRIPDSIPDLDRYQNYNRVQRNLRNRRLPCI